MSPKAGRISALVFITKGPQVTIGSPKGLTAISMNRAGESEGARSETSSPV